MIYLLFTCDLPMIYLDPSSGLLVNYSCVSTLLSSVITTLTSQNELLYMECNISSDTEKRESPCICDIPPTPCDTSSLVSDYQSDNKSVLMQLP